MRTARSRNNYTARLACLLSLALLASCGGETPPAATAVVPAPEPAPPVITVDPAFDAPSRALLGAYLERIETDFLEAQANVEFLRQQIATFLQSPGLPAMNSVRSSWLSAHGSYETTALHRHFAGLILNEEASLRWWELNYNINHWPILPGYVDYVGGYNESGIVNDVNVQLDIPNVRLQHGTFDLAEAAVGFHVLEFLVWGENPAGLDPRPADDYVEALTLNAAQRDAGFRVDQLPNNRRRTLLELLATALDEDMSSTLQLWQEGGQLFAQDVESLDTVDVLVLFVEAMAGMLTEELLVRSLYPLLNGEYDVSIQSPYSRSTQNAVTVQLAAVESLLTYSDDASNGISLDSIFSDISPAYGNQFFANFDQSKECLVLLYSNLDIAADSTLSSETEFEIVECINLLTNMIDNLEQVKVNLYAAD